MPNEILVSLAERANTEHAAAVGCAAKAIEHARRCGELLLEAKQDVPHGEWMQWLESNFKGSPRTAQKYMKLAGNWDLIEAKNEDSSYLGVDSALRLLMGPQAEKPPSEADGLPEPIQVYRKANAISDAHACQLLRLKDTYGDLSVDFSFWDKRGRFDFDFNKSEGAWGLLHYGLRPEDWPVTYFPHLMGDSDPGVVGTACEAFVTQVRESGYRVPQWYGASLWWATMAASYPISSIVFADAIRLWGMRFHSAVFYVCTNDKPAADERGGAFRQLREMDWYGYRSDLRHSNALSSVVEGNGGAMLENALMNITRNGDTLLAPSVCQRNAPRGTEYQEATLRLEYLDLKRTN